MFPPDHAYKMSLVVRKPVFGVSAMSDTNRAVQPHKMARGLKFRIYVETGLYYPYSKNKGADQLHGHREADLLLCFRICKKPVFSQRRSFIPSHPTFLYMYIHVLKLDIRGVYNVFFPFF